MSGLNLFDVQEEILLRLRAQIPWQIESGGIEDAFQIAETSGVQNPYIVIRFSDGTPQGGGGSFLGSRYDEYYSLADAFCVASNDREARQLSSWVDSVLIGFKPTNATQISKHFGGGDYSQPAENSTPQYYISTAAFKFTYNMIADGTGYEGT